MPSGLELLRHVDPDVADGPLVDPGPVPTEELAHGTARNVRPRMRLGTRVVLPVPWHVQRFEPLHVGAAVHLGAQAPVLEGLVESQAQVVFDIHRQRRYARHRQRTHQAPPRDPVRHSDSLLRFAASYALPKSGPRYSFSNEVPALCSDQAQGGT